MNHFVFHLLKKEAGADPKKIGSGSSSNLNRLWLQPKKLRIRLRNTAVVYSSFKRQYMAQAGAGARDEIRDKGGARAENK